MRRFILSPLSLYNSDPPYVEAVDRETISEKRGVFLK